MKMSAILCMTKALMLISALAMIPTAAVGKKTMCSGDTLYHLKLADSSWKDYKVYLADQSHHFGDATDEPGAAADEKNLQHELDWVHVNGDVATCPRHAIQYYVLSARLTVVRVNTRYDMDKMTQEEVLDNPNEGADFKAQSQSAMIRGWNNVIDDLAVYVSMLHRYKYYSTNAAEYESLKRFLLDNAAKKEIQLPADWEAHTITPPDPI